LKAAAASDLPFAPGIATASELMQALAAGFDLVKFFPAEQAGGIKALRALAGPFPNIGYARPAALARPMPRPGWPSRMWWRWAVPGCVRPPISGPATGPA
jgi:hypothetical protein